VRKEVVQPTRDTITVTRVDTVTIRRVDTVATTVMRYDTVTRMVYPPLAKLPGTFFGIGAGANIPMNNIRAVLKDSWAVQGQVGYFPGDSPLGLRADATFGQFGHRETDCAGCKDPKMWTVGADVILRWPIDRQGKLNPVLYVFGGGGWASLSDVDPRQTAFFTRSVEPNLKTGGKAYWDVGPGVDFTLGGLHFYAEGRYMTIMTDRASAHAFPVYGGLKFY
jgi:hypothetical protein